MPGAPALYVLIQIAVAPVTHSLAMPGWSTVGVAPELGAFCSERVAKTLRDEGLKVVTAAEIAALLSAERQKQLLGCSDDSSNCLAELANALGTDATLVARVARLGDAFHAQLKVLRSSDSAVLAESQVEAADEKKLLAALDGAARRLAAAILPPPSKRPFAVIPAVLAAGGLGTGVALLLVARGQFVLLTHQLVVPQDADRDPALTTAHNGELAQTFGWLAVSVGIAAAVAAVALLVFGGGGS